MATIFDPDKRDKKENGPRTYAIKIEIFDLDFEEDTPVATFYKFGYATTSISKRFSKEKSDILITILEIWFHETLEQARSHEEFLIKKYRPTLLFWGFPPCSPQNGPLSLSKGNSELFLANRIRKEPDIKLPKAEFWEDYTFSGHFRYERCYFPEFHEKHTYDHGYLTRKIEIYKGFDVPGWLKWLQAVPEEYIFLPHESQSKNKLIFVRENYLFRFEDFWGSKRKREELQNQAKHVSTFEEALEIRDYHCRGRFSW